MRRDTRVVPFEIKSASSADGGMTFEGTGAVYLNLDRGGDIIEPGALARDLDYTRQNGVIRDEHHVTTGRIEDATDGATGLLIKGLILPTTAGNDQYTLIKGKAVKWLSIGYETLEREWLEGPAAVQAYWQTKGYAPTEDDLIRLGSAYSVRLIKRARVYEVTTTWAPMNDKASITSVKSLDAPGRLTFTDHSDRVARERDDLVGRAEAISAKRAEKGRALSRKSLDSLRSLGGRISTLTDAAPAPAPEATDTDLNDLALFDKHLEREARITAAL